MKAIYAGTFDPITNGHLDVIERASHLFDELYITIFNNPEKSGTFSIEERETFIKDALKDKPGIHVTHSDALVVEYAKEVGAKFLVRGLRATQDYNYESMMAYANQYLDNEIETIFFMTRLSHTFISSSTIKEIASHHRDVSSLVPECVNDALIKKYGENQ